MAGQREIKDVALNGQSSHREQAVEAIEAEGVQVSGVSVKVVIAERPSGQAILDRKRHEDAALGHTGRLAQQS